MRRPELATHRAVAAYLKTVLPDTVFWTTFPAGGGGRTRGAILKSLGLAPGVPDVLIVSDGRVYWIELKAEDGRITKAQGACHARLWEAGCPVLVAKTIDDVREALWQWHIPNRDVHARAA